MVKLIDVHEDVPEKNSDIIEVDDITSPNITEAVEATDNLKIIEGEQSTVLPVTEQIKLLTAVCDALSKNYLEMRIAFNELKLSFDDLNRKIRNLQCKYCTVAYGVRTHKHTISGEVVIPSIQCRCE